jgi:uncharacterized protein YecT (DUF1311 family)
MSPWPTAALALILAVSGRAVATARAEGPAYTPAYGRCLAKPDGQSTAGMINCIGDELQIQDKRLTLAYRGAQGRLTTPRQKAALQKAQRAWIAYRDADCDSQTDPDWGTISRITAANCRLEHTYSRANDLENYGPP